MSKRPQSGLDAMNTALYVLRGSTTAAHMRRMSRIEHSEIYLPQCVAKELTKLSTETPMSPDGFWKTSCAQFGNTRNEVGAGLITTSTRSTSLMHSNAFLMARTQP